MTELLKLITVADLHRHFLTVYKLTDDQAGRMVASSARSARDVLIKGDEALRDRDGAKLVAFAHSLKGLLLNMGQQVWAEKAHTFEMVAKGEKSGDLRDILSDLRSGLKELENYHEKKGDTS